MKSSIKWFMAFILLTGIARFALTVFGLPNTAIRFASMSVVIAIGAVYFAINSSTHMDRLKDAYLLILPYMSVEVAALLYTWWSGRPTIFHAAEYSFGTSIGQHTLGHLAGGLTWEPLILFLFMEIVWAVATFARQRLGASRT